MFCDSLNIVKDNNSDIYLIGKKYKKVECLYELPCKSDQLDIQVMTMNNDTIYFYPVTELKCKT